MSENLGIHDEVRSAFLPRTERVAGHMLHAPCMGHVLALSRHAPEILSRCVPFSQVAIAAAILSISPDQIAECQAEVPASARLTSARLPMSMLRKLLDAILGLFAEAFECDVPAGDPSAPSGLGWWLEFYYFAAHDLHMDHKSILACPLARLFALSVASAAAYGNKFRAPSYAERCTLQELENQPPAEEGK